MPYAVELALDAEAGRVVRALWEALSDAGVTGKAPPGAEPHVSVAIWEHVDRARLEAELARVADETAPISITLDAIGSFAGGVVFLRPADETALRELHARLHRLFRGLGREAWDYYLVDAWTPHCTLASDVPPDRLDEAVAVARRAPLPIVGRLEAIALVEFRPVRPLARYPLAGSG